MGHYNVDKYREKKIVVAPTVELKELEQNDETDGELNDAGGTNPETLNQSTEKSLQPDGSDDGTMHGEPIGGDGTLTKQTDTDNDVAGLGTDETKAKPKSGTKRVRRETAAFHP